MRSAHAPLKLGGLVAGFAFALGCAPIEEGPEQLSEVLEESYVRFDGTSRRIRRVAVDLPLIAETLAPELGAGIGLRLLEAADVGLDADDARPRQLPTFGAAFANVYESELEDVVAGLVHPERHVVFGEVAEWTAFDPEKAERDSKRFVDWEIDHYVVEGEEGRKAGVFGIARHDTTIEIRRVHLGDDTSYVWRLTTPEPVRIELPGVGVGHIYAGGLLYEQDGVTHRVDAFWTRATLMGTVIGDRLPLDYVRTLTRRDREHLDRWVRAQKIASTYGPPKPEDL